MKKVGIVMGSDSDLPIVGKAVDTLKSFDICVIFTDFFSAIKVTGFRPYENFLS